MTGVKKQKETKVLQLGDDAIETQSSDFFNFQISSAHLADQLYLISKSSGVCCGIIGSWGSGKSSFMHLMDTYIKEKYPKNVCVSWFTAWDPGGIKDLGDAMLYRLFQDIAGKEKGLQDDFKQLKEALGLRKSIRERAQIALNFASSAIPDSVVKKVVDASNDLLSEWESPVRIKTIFQNLFNWLKHNDRTVFFFIDDIDRATADQIKDIFSELKVYLSNPRIAIIIGYDEKYILDSLKNVLPNGISPPVYVEKIITLKRHLPIPDFTQITDLGIEILRTNLGLNEASAFSVSRIASILTSNNPRRMKSTLLAFCDYLKGFEVDKLGENQLASRFIVVTSAIMGLLEDSPIKSALNEGNEGKIVEALNSFVEKNPTQRENIEKIENAISYVTPDFESGIVSDFHLTDDRNMGIIPEIMRTIMTDSFEWRKSFYPIIKAAAYKGFTISSSVAYPEGIIVNPKTDVEKIKFEAFKELRISHYQTLSYAELYKLSLDDTKIVFLTSEVESEERVELSIIDNFLDNCTIFVTDQDFCLWVIDDKGTLDQRIDNRIKRASVISKNLKHSFSLKFTSSSKVPELLTNLLKSN